MLLGLLIAGSGDSVVAAESTSFELIKEGNRHVGQDAKDKVVQIGSEKSLGTTASINVSTIPGL